MSTESELLLLGLLQRQAMHGYELHEFLDHRLHFVTDLKKPTAYRLLDVLYQRGLVARTAERAGRRPERLVYSLTPAGQQHFRRLLREQLGRAEPVRYPHNIALLFSDQLGESERRDLLRRRGLALRAQLEDTLLAVDAHAPGTAPRVVLEHDATMLRAELDWLERTVGVEQS
jgi:DNA-binding PadR family transcriptional regulator